MNGLDFSYRQKRITNRCWALCALLFLAMSATTIASAEITKFTDPATGLISWKVVDNGFSLQLIQLHPDYVTAVYSSRGLPKKLIDGVLKYCVFGTIVKNESKEDVSYKVADWQYSTKDGKRHPVKTKSEWLKEWEAMGVGYRWSMLADEQTFSPGDWIQGFTTIPVQPGDSFDLHYKWIYKGKNFSNTLKGMRCASSDEKQK